MVPDDGWEASQSVTVQRQTNRRFIPHDLRGVDIVVRHRHAVTGFNHDLSDLDHFGPARFSSIIGTSVERVTLAPGDGGMGMSRPVLK